MLNKTYRLILAVSFALAGLMTSALPVAAQASRYNLRMENETGYPIYQLYFSSSGGDSWGSDRLGTQVFHDGDTFTLRGISPRLYDLKFVFRNGVACEVYDVAIYEDEDVDLTAESLLRGCDYWQEP